LTLVRRLHGVTVRAYRGFRWRRVRVSRWHLGLFLGELARTRKVTRYRAKVRRKRNKGKTAVSRRFGFNEERWLENIRQVKSGKRRRTLDLNPLLEAQLRQVAWVDHQA
jgi:hypothetical protein